jgi:hypothetical protein
MSRGHGRWERAILQALEQHEEFALFDIQHTVRYTELRSDRSNRFWKD